jgi:hypothetical protein
MSSAAATPASSCSDQIIIEWNQQRVQKNPGLSARRRLNGDLVAGFGPFPAVLNTSSEVRMRSLIDVSIKRMGFVRW